MLVARACAALLLMHACSGRGGGADCLLFEQCWAGCGGLFTTPSARVCDLGARYFWDCS